MVRTDRQPVERNLAMELVRVTEAAAMAASLHMGKGQKELLDGAERYLAGQEWELVRTEREVVVVGD